MAKSGETERSGVTERYVEAKEDQLLPVKPPAPVRKKLKMPLPHVAPARIISRSGARPKATIAELSKFEGSAIGDIEVDESAGVMEMSANSALIVPEGKWNQPANPLVWDNPDPEEVKSFIRGFPRTYFVGRR